MGITTGINGITTGIITGINGVYHRDQQESSQGSMGITTTGINGDHSKDQQESV
jgi:hypothetical protein